MIENLPDYGTKSLLIIDKSCEEISSFKQFLQSKLGRDVELQNTHIVLFKSRRDVSQIVTLSQQLGLRSRLKAWYQDAMSIPYGHLLIQLTPKTVDSLRYSFDSGSVTNKIDLPAGRDSLWTISILYVSILPVFRKLSMILLKQFILSCPKDFNQFLSECLVNLIRGELRKEDVLKCLETSE